MSEEKEFYTVRDLAKLLQVTEMTVYRMIRRGDLPHYKIGRSKRFRRDDVEAFLEKCRVGGANDDSTSSDVDED